MGAALLALTLLIGSMVWANERPGEARPKIQLTQREILIYQVAQIDLQISTLEQQRLSLIQQLERTTTTVARSGK